MPDSPTSYVAPITPEQVQQLRVLLEAKGWAFTPLQYAHWKATHEKTTIVAFLSGKLTVAGKGTSDIVQFVIEPEVLKEARYGYATEHKLDANPEMLQPHAGIDESGKGDFFGPLVIAAVYTEGAEVPALLKAGVADSKTIKSDKRILALADEIRQRTLGRFSVVSIGPETYNRLYAKIGNLNRLLAWGHARALENLLEKAPLCPRAISDQFGSQTLVQRALLEKGRSLKLEQHPRAEADVAVAAASILARAEFITRLAQLGTKLSLNLPRGAGPEVNARAKELAARGGRELLGTVAKMHFRTAYLAMGEEPPEREEHWFRRSSRKVDEA